MGIVNKKIKVFAFLLIFLTSCGGNQPAHLVGQSTENCMNIPELRIDDGETIEFNDVVIVSSGVLTVSDSIGNQSIFSGTIKINKCVRCEIKKVDILRWEIAEK